MKKIAAVAMTILLAPVASAEARWLWPWEIHYHHKKITHHKKVVHKRPVVSQQWLRVDDPPNCPQINAAIKTLNPENYEMAMRRATPTQKAYIAACQGVKP